MGMTELEYENRIAEIEKEYVKAKHKLYTEYALSNAKYSVGDIISGQGSLILIRKISVTKYIGLPSAVYSGTELKKDLTPRKDGKEGIIHESSAELVKKSVTEAQADN